MDEKIKHLLKEAVNGNIDAYGKLYEFYSLDMYRFALSICKNPADAEDAVQETALSVYKSIGTIKNREKFKSYLFISLSNTCKKKLVKKMHGEELFENIKDDKTQSDIQFTYEIKEALFKLDEVARKILVLSVIAGFKSKEIGKMLDMPASTVRTKLRRALESMRKELSK